MIDLFLGREETLNAEAAAYTIARVLTMQAMTLDKNWWKGARPKQIEVER